MGLLLLKAADCEMTLSFKETLVQKGPFCSYGMGLTRKGLIGPSRAGVGVWMDIGEGLYPSP